MKQKLLVVGSNLPCDINIGDYIQAVAASQYLNRIDGYIEREQLKEYEGDDCTVIMNGWYMHNPEQWPPSNRIKPLFVSFHMNKMVVEKFLSNASIDYLKKNQPIGCRDTYTMELLRNKGVNAYFSGCLTLTLGLNYKSQYCSGKTYFVDPYFKILNRSLFWKFKASLYFAYNIFDTLKIIKVRRQKTPMSIGKLLDNAWFLKTYSQVFDRKLLLNSNYIYHESPYYKDKLKTNEERILYAKDLIKNYSEASLVVTSRIHCALPCTGMEVPVIYIENEEQDEISFCRLGGLKELFNIVKFKNCNLYHNLNIKGKISENNYPQIKFNYRDIAKKLQFICENFINNNSK